MTVRPLARASAMLLLTVACRDASPDPGSGTTDASSDTANTDTGTEPPDFACAVDRPFPYPSPMSYVGVHASPRNDDLVDCDLGGSWTSVWHVLQGRGIAQPNTFSPDGATTYVTTSEPSPGDCTLWALDVETGATQWCLPVPGALAATIEVDVEGNLYVTADATVSSWDQDGQPRWSTPIPGDAPERNATGLHFSPAGHVATVTDAGMVMLLGRADGQVLAELDLPGALGLVPAAGLGLELDFEMLLPDAVGQDFATLFGAGGVGGALGKFAGGSGNFSDNTLAVADDGTLYVVGGGLDDAHGALVQIRVEGTDDVPSLVPGWLVELTGSSASSPSVSSDGAWVKVSDGNSLAGFLDPATAEAHAHIVDIATCDANDDADPAPDRCAPAHSIPLLTGPALGASPVLDGGESWRWEVQFASLYDHSSPDVVSSKLGEDVLAFTLPDDRVWSSVLTISRDHIVGTMTALTPSNAEVLSITLPAEASSELVVLDRATGAVVFSAPITDDSTSTVTIGPDGSLYVTMLALLHTLSVDTRPVGGLMRFAPEPT